MIDLEGRIAGVQAANPGVRVDCYVLFESHTDAMRLYEIARESDLNARISTTPRQARSCCGVALLVASDDAVAVEALARESGIPVEDIVALPNQIDPSRDVYC